MHICTCSLPCRPHGIELKASARPTRQGPARTHHRILRLPQPGDMPFWALTGRQGLLRIGINGILSFFRTNVNHPAKLLPRGHEKKVKYPLTPVDCCDIILYVPSERAPIAQLDRAFDYESKGHRFESCWVHHNLSENNGFQTFLLSNFNTKPSQKAKNRGLSTPVFPISGMKVRDKNACAQ